MRPEALVLLAALLASPGAIAALATTWEQDFDDESKSWKEIEAQMPSYPKTENLVLLDVGSVTPHRYWVDAASVSLGADEVLRYTMVVKTAGGATNITYEGMRCETREGKLYAVGRSDGTWTRARNPKWERIVLRNDKLYQMLLYRDYFCPSRSRPTPPKVALDAMRRGTSLGPSRNLDE